MGIPQFFLDPTIGIESPIDGDDGPGNKTGGITDQPMNRPLEFVGPSKAFHRSIVYDSPTPFGISTIFLQEEFFVLASNEKARGYGIYPKAIPIFQGKVRSHPFGEIVHGRLGS